MRHSAAAEESETKTTENDNGVEGTSRRAPDREYLKDRRAAYIRNRTSRRCEQSGRIDKGGEGRRRWRNASGLVTVHRVFA